MKRLFLVLIFLLSVSGLSFADSRPIQIKDKGAVGDHSQYYPPADLPEVYFDSGNLEIIIVADGFSTYYDVEITSTTGNIPIISTRVDGYGDSIDVSYLPVDDYSIIITSEFNNQYEGQFVIE